jgi:hypothetical protein
LRNYTLKNIYGNVLSKTNETFFFLNLNKRETFLGKSLRGDLLLKISIEEKGKIPGTGYFWPISKKLN